MKYAMTVTTVVLLLFAGVAILACYRRCRVNRSHLSHLATTPPAEPQAGVFDSQIQESDSQIQVMVNRLYNRHDQFNSFEHLKLVGSRAIPFLVDALGRQDTRLIRFDGTGRVFVTDSPFERICRLLSPLAAPEAVRPLESYLDHEDARFRALAAMAIGSIGAVECSEPIQRALFDDDDSVRHHAMLGILRAMASEHCAEEFRDCVFPAIVKLLDMGRRSDGRKAPEVLIAMNADRAIPILFSPVHFSPKNQQIDYILRAVNGAGRKIPHELLLPFLEATKHAVEQYPCDHAYAEALIAYAHNPDNLTVQTLESALSSTNRKIQTCAADGLAILSDVASARLFVLRAVDEFGFDSLHRQQQLYFAVFEYDGEVRNGGHSQYFLNAEKGHWEIAIEGLAAMGAPSKSQILREATQVFHNAGPSARRDEDGLDFQRLTRRQILVLEQLDRRYYSCSENIEAILAAFAVQHIEFFHDVPKE